MPDDHQKQARIAIGIAWYRKDQWDLLRILSADGADIEQTYEEWEAVAITRTEEMELAGAVVSRVDMDIREVAAWCRRKGVPLDGDARARYCADRMRKLDPGPEDGPSTGRRRPPKRR